MFEGTGLLELAWESGQIVMKGHSSPPSPPPANRPQTSPFFNLNPGLDKPQDSNMNQSISDDKASELKNFSLFLKPKLLVKGYGGTSFDTRSTLVGPSSLRLEELKPSNPGLRSGLVDSSLVVSSRRSNCHHVLNNTERVETPLVDWPPHRDDALNGKCGEQVQGLKPSTSPYCTEKLPVGHQLGWTSSACSRGDSNDVALPLRHRHQRNEERAYSDDEEEEEPALSEKLGAKRKRKALGHNISEKKRRERINKRLNELQHLLPNSNKVDKASMLDDAITHIRTLQFQLQMMSMGQGLYNYMPQMMLQNGSMRHTQLYPLHPLMGLAFGPNLQPGSAAGFSSAPLPTTPAMIDLRQLVAPLPTTLQCAPSIPFVGSQTPVPVQPRGSSLDQLVSAPMFTRSKDQNHQNLHPRTS